VSLEVIKGKVKRLGEGGEELGAGGYIGGHGSVLLLD
jgi:hypothetical protein